jgi:hypothetical protein
MFCIEKNTQEIGNIQDRPLKVSLNGYNGTYEDFLEKSKLRSLKNRKIRTIAIENLKIIYQQRSVYLHDLIQINENKYYYRHQNTA